MIAQCVASYMISVFLCTYKYVYSSMFIQCKTLKLTYHKMPNFKYFSYSYSYIIMENQLHTLAIAICFIYHTGNSGLSTVAVAVIASAVTFILTLTVTAIITFIVTCICVKRILDKANTHNYKHQSPDPQEKVLYEQVTLPSHTVTKNDLELQPNPAYGTSHKLTMGTNPAYESCK